MSRRPAVNTLMLIFVAILALPLQAQQKPFTQEQVSSMVRDGFGDESGAKLIEQRGIDFTPSDNFIQTLKAAGASEAFLKALRTAKPSEPASPKKPINQVQVITLLAAQVPSRRVAALVRESGVDFEPTDEYLQEVRLAGGDGELVSALKSAKVTKPAILDRAAQAREAEVRQHVTLGAQFLQAKRYADAEAEYRAAVRLDPRNANLRTALGTAILASGDSDGAIEEEREALRLDPSNENAHVGIGNALADKGDWNGAASEFREALHQDPENEYWHCNLGAALGEMGNLDGAIAEYREALRLDANNATAHTGLGIGLERKGDLRGALGEYRAAYMLDPKDPLFKQNYERLLLHVNQ